MISGKWVAWLKQKNYGRHVIYCTCFNQSLIELPCDCNNSVKQMSNCSEH